MCWLRNVHWPNVRSGGSIRQVCCVCLFELTPCSMEISFFVYCPVQRTSVRSTMMAVEPPRYLCITKLFIFFQPFPHACPSIHIALSSVLSHQALEDPTLRGVVVSFRESLPTKLLQRGLQKGKRLLQHLMKSKRVNDTGQSIY